MKSTTSEKPIIFSGPMVRAILDGKKTQTRRVVKPQPGALVINAGKVSAHAKPAWRWETQHEQVEAPFACPYGKPGDTMWVRETCDFCAGDEFVPVADRRIVYRADDEQAKPTTFGRWCSPIHMPRWASRLSLRITDVRVERLQEISEEDAKAEGVEPLDSDAPESRGPDDFDYALCGNCGGLRLYTAFRDGGAMPDTDCGQCDTHAKRFQWAWHSINGKRAPWASNPWVWVVSFERIGATA
jgi:hypothetical protein